MKIQTAKQLSIFLTILLTGASVVPPSVYAHDQNSGHWGAIVLDPFNRVCYAFQAHSPDEAIKTAESIGCSGGRNTVGQGWGAAYITGDGGIGASFAPTRAESEAQALQLCEEMNGVGRCNRALVLYTSASSVHYENWNHYADSPRDDYSYGSDFLNIPYTPFSPLSTCEPIHSHDPFDNCP
jgi:hypothetical protein